MSSGSKIRAFFHDLFGSKLAEQLQDQLLMLRQDFEHRLLEKDRVLLDYKTELDAARNKLAQYELVLIPLASPVGKQLNNLLHPNTKPEFITPENPSSWEQEQVKWYQKQLEEEKAALSNLPAEPDTIK